MFQNGDTPIWSEPERLLIGPSQLGQLSLYARMRKIACFISNVSSHMTSAEVLNDFEAINFDVILA